MESCSILPLRYSLRSLFDGSSHHRSSSSFPLSICSSERQAPETSLVYRKLISGDVRLNIYVDVRREARTEMRKVPDQRIVSTRCPVGQTNTRNTYAGRTKLEDNYGIDYLDGWQKRLLEAASLMQKFSQIRLTFPRKSECGTEEDQ